MRKSTSTICGANTARTRSMPAPSRPAGGFSRNLFSRSWPPEFLDRNPLEDKTQVEYRLQASDPTTVADPPAQISKDEPNRLQLFFRAYDDDVPTIQEEEIADFCQGAHTSILKQPDRGHRTAAWLDDRLYSFYRETKPFHSDKLHLEASKTGAHATCDPQTSLPTRRGSEDITNYDTGQNKSANLPYRKYDLPLSASSLYKHLKEKVR
jgi:hypothetical protein